MEPIGVNLNSQNIQAYTPDQVYEWLQLVIQTATEEHGEEVILSKYDCLDMRQAPNIAYSCYNQLMEEPSVSLPLTVKANGGFVQLDRRRLSF